MCKSKTRYLAGLLAVLLIVPLFSVTAFASGGDYVEEPIPETTVAPGEPLSEETDIVTRDLLYDKATNKQFITVQDRDGNTFYIVIDYDAATGEDEEQYKTYFLNPVDADDLAALAKDKQEKPPACICSEKCVPGKINMNCPVCASNMSECMGKEPEPAETEPEPSLPSEPEPEKKPGVNPAALIGLLVLAGGGGAAVFMKLKKGKSQTAAPNADDYDYEEDGDEDEPWETEDDENEEDAAENSEEKLE